MILPDLSASAKLVRKTRSKAHKESSIQPELPCIPSKRLSSDLLEYRRQQSLLLSDCYSKLPINRKLTSTSSLAIRSHIFAEHSIPFQVITPEYKCLEFRQFTELYGIKHITSFPLYPQSNGFAERMVQTVKNTLRACVEEGEDQYL